jgi:ABC-2 type transport system ATP-binding protein
MESVEELCDHIALIHKSNKLIEGKLDEVKDNLKPIVLKWVSDNVESLMYSLTKKFTVGPANFKSLNNELKLEIQLGNATPNELLNILTQCGQVTHFVRFQV